MIVKQTNWISLVFAIRGTALRTILPRLIFTTGAAVAVAVLQETTQVFSTSLSVVPFSLVGVALGIFLGFRNNTAYDRFWEGRKLWGALVNASRSTARQILTLVDARGEGRRDEGAAGERGEGGDEARRALHRELVYRVIGYVHALRLHLRDDKSLDDLRPFFPAEELAALEREHNRPIALLQRLGDRLREIWQEGGLHAYHLALLEKSLTELTAIQGACERIKNTPIPFSYTVLIHRIVLFYCLGLPFGIADQVGVLTPLVVFMVSYAFFGLDAIGDEIEQPFGEDHNDLPLSQLSRMIEVNLRQRLGETELPELLVPDEHGRLR